MNEDATTDLECGGQAAFEIITAARETPLVFASPHSGSVYPPDLRSAALPVTALRSAEDALVDRLVASGPQHGATLLAGRIARTYLDLNRRADEWDPLLIEDCPPGPVSTRAQAGYGVVPRLTGDGHRLYDRRLPQAEALDRVARVHRPYHRALAELMQGAQARHGVAVLIDWHSMPSRATGGDGGADIVLGDRHGTSCPARLTRRLRALFEGLGWRVALNRPYAGGYATQTWGRPPEGFWAIQVELNRALYLDEATLEPGLGWSRCSKGLERVITALTNDIDGLVR